MLKLGLVVMFLLSLATLSFASSLVPSPENDIALAAPGQPQAWVHTFE